MQDVRELVRHPAPAGRPQPLAFHEGTLWIGCWDTSHLYAVDTKSWTVTDSVRLPGKPYGLASFDGALTVVISIGEDDDRYFYRFTPGKGFDEASKTACPDLSGSHLTSDGTSLYLLQMGNGRILVFDTEGAVQRTIDLPSRIAGFAFAGETLNVIGADDDFDVLEFGALDIARATPVYTSLAPMAPEARALATDGTSFWTNYRELNETVSFSA